MFFTESVVRGHHVYKDVWIPFTGEELVCQREIGNLRDLFAVSVCKGATIVGHVPRRILAICSTYVSLAGRQHRLYCDWN